MAVFGEIRPFSAKKSESFKNSPKIIQKMDINLSAS
jgi:hypothetical protein